MKYLDIIIGIVLSFILAYSAMSLDNGDFFYSQTSTYYDNRDATVVFSCDDPMMSYVSTVKFNQMVNTLEKAKIWNTIGIVTGGGGPVTWEMVQSAIDNGYNEIASHSHTHPSPPYSDPEAEIGGSKNLIISNLNLPYKNGSKEYVYSWLRPYGGIDNIIRSKMQEHKYLISRGNGTGIAYDDFGTWNNTYGFYELNGTTNRLDNNWLINSAYTLEKLNSDFDTIINAGGIYYGFLHPQSVDWSTDGMAYQHIQYIKERTNLWYTSLGYLELYHWTTNHVSVSENGSGWNEIFSMSIDNTDHVNFGASYPITYEFDNPTGLFDIAVEKRYTEDGVWQRIPEKQSIDFFNGIEMVRFDYDNNKIYISVAFSNVSDHIYIRFRPTNTPPNASNPHISPALPLTGDDLQANYDYSDSENDPEFGTEIRWYRNTVLQGDYNDQKIVPASTTAKGEQWHFTVRPKDGKSFGELKVAASLLIGNTSPVVRELFINPVLPLITDDLTGSYTYFDADGNEESGSEIRWYRNNVVENDFNDLLTIPASATSWRERWHFTVRPKDGENFGDVLTSVDVSIEGVVLRMKPGWNLISFSVNKCFYQGEPPSDQPEFIELVDVNDLGFDSLAEWFSSVVFSNIEAVAWEMFIGMQGAMDSSLPSVFHSLKYMSPCSAYWVKIKEGTGGAVLSIEGTIFNPNCPINLQEGWVLVGCPLDVSYYDTDSPPVGSHVPAGITWKQVNPSVAEYVFSSILGKYDLIIGEAGAYNPSLDVSFNSLHFIAPGYGYWIKMKQAWNLLYPQGD